MLSEANWRHRRRAGQLAWGAARSRRQPGGGAVQSPDASRELEGRKAAGALDGGNAPPPACVVGGGRPEKPAGFRWRLTSRQP